jgi:hypothetical protein
VTAPVQAKPAAKSGNQKAAVPLRPFKVGVQDMDDEPFDKTVTTGSSAVALDQYAVPSTAFLNDIEMLVQGTTAGNGAAVTFAADGPFNVIDSMIFTDTGNSEIISSVTGWDLAMINKWGGYRFNDDPRNSPIYSATTGAGATGGSFAFLLRIPMELVKRDALGSLPNKSQSTPFKVKISVAPTATIYGTPPTAAPSVRFRFVPKSYWQPTQTDGSGNPVADQPPGVGTTQYWNKTDYEVASGSVTVQLTNSTGFPVRNLVFVLRDSNGSRTQGESDWPDPVKLQLQSNIIVDRIKTVWQHELSESYGYSGAVASGTALAKDSGVYVIPFCDDFYPKPGWENRRKYLRTTDGMRLQFKGNIGGSGTHKLTVLTNYVGVAGGVSLAQITT